MLAVEYGASFRWNENNMENNKSMDTEKRNFDFLRRLMYFVIVFCNLNLRLAQVKILAELILSKHVKPSDSCKPYP